MIKRLKKDEKIIKKNTKKIKQLEKPKNAPKKRAQSAQIQRQRPTRNLHHLGHHPAYNALGVALSNAPAPRPVVDVGTGMYAAPFRSVGGTYAATINLDCHSSQNTAYVFYVTPDSADPIQYMVATYPTGGTCPLSALGTNNSSNFVVDRIMTPDTILKVPYLGVEPRSLIAAPSTTQSDHQSKHAPCPLQQFCGGQYKFELSVPYDKSLGVYSLGPDENKQFWSTEKQPFSAGVSTSVADFMTANTGVSIPKYHFPAFGTQTTLNAETLRSKMHSDYLMGSSNKSSMCVKGVLAQTHGWIPVQQTFTAVSLVDNGMLSYNVLQQPQGNGLAVTGWSRACVIVDVPPGSGSGGLVRIQGQNKFHVSITHGDLDSDFVEYGGASLLLLEGSSTAANFSAPRVPGAMGRGANESEAGLNAALSYCSHPALRGVEGHVEEALSKPMNTALESCLVPIAAHPEHDDEKAMTKSVAITAKPSMWSKARTGLANAGKKILESKSVQDAGEKLVDKFAASKGVQKMETVAEDAIGAAADKLAGWFGFSI